MIDNIPKNKFVMSPQQREKYRRLRDWYQKWKPNVEEVTTESTERIPLEAWKELEEIESL